MRKRDNFKDVENLRKMLSETKKLTLENYILPEEDNSFEEEMPIRQEEMPQENGDDITGIEKELTQIRKIALSVINRLADQPTSEDYNTMKKVWNLVDRAIENINNNGNENT